MSIDWDHRFVAVPVNVVFAELRPTLTLTDDTPLVSRVATLIEQDDLEVLPTSSPQPSPLPTCELAVLEKGGPASLQVIRQVAERMRELQERSHAAVNRAQQMAHTAVLAMQAAEERARRAEAATRDVMEKAEAQLNALRRQIAETPAPSTNVEAWLQEAHLRLRLMTDARSDGRRS